MSTALKDRYNTHFYTTFCTALYRANIPVDVEKFRKNIFTPAFHQAELKGRMSHTATVLKQYLSIDFSEACNQIVTTIGVLKEMGIGENFEYMFLPEFVSTNGIDNLSTSMKTLALITPFTSAEFAVRPFIVKYPNQMVEQLQQWSLDQHPKVRRLSSEGARPRLPWAMALPQFKKDPSPIIPILENLKNDPDEWVRRSVSNYLNDISKDNPTLAKEITHRWYGQNERINAVVKHGCRSLLKSGDSDILQMFGLDPNGLVLNEFNISNRLVKMGERLQFEFQFTNSSNHVRTIRIEYILHLMKKNGNLSQKIFKISEREVTGGETITIQKNHHFKPITTRVYYAGLHKLTVVLNGKEFGTLDFYLEL